MSENLTDKTLEGFHNTGAEVAVYLRDGSRITGKVVDFDGYTVIISGAPDSLVYRHSILKLLSAEAALKAASQRPEQRKSGGDRRSGPKPTKPRREPRPERHVEQKHASSEPGFANPMADAMQKWLKSQKGGG